MASELAAIKLISVNKINGIAAWSSVGACFAQQPDAPHRSSVNTGSLITGMLEVIEGDSTKEMAELSLAGDEAENGSNVSDGSIVWDSVVASVALSLPHLKTTGVQGLQDRRK